MPDVSLNGISFEIKGSTDEASKSIDALQNKLGSLRSSLAATSSAAKKTGKTNAAGPLSNELQDLVNKADKLQVLKMKLDLLKESLSNAFSKGDLAGAVRFKAQIISTTEAVKKLQMAAASRSVSKDVQDTIQNADKRDLLRYKIAGLRNDLQDAFQSGNTQKALGIQGQILSAEEAIKRIDDAANKSKLEAYQKKVEATQERLKKLGDVAKKAGKNLANVIAGPLISGAKGAKDFAGGISKTIGGFKRILGYRIIRSVIKEITQGFQEGIKNLYGWSALVGGEFKTSMDSIATDMQYLKNSIAAAAAPIINALAPAIEFLTDKIVGLINIINQLFAKLTGATYWTRAKRKADEYGDAVSGAGAAAKEALKYLAPFDELNRLPDERGGRGSGGNQEDYSDMFEDVTEFNEGISNFADMLREKVNAGDWQGLGTLLGEKVNDVINMIDFAGLGAKVGTGINAWFTTKYWTFETINFQNIGSKIAEFLNNMMSGIDFDIIGRTITQKFTNLGDLIIGAVRDINWTNVGSSVSSVISGAFNQLSEWIQNINWVEVGTSFYNMFKNTLDGIDFGAIASSVFSLLGSALSAAVTALATVVYNIVKDISNYFLQYIKDEDGDGHFGGGEIIAGLLKGITNALVNIGTWIVDNVFKPLWTGLKNAFGINSPATTMIEPGQMIGEGILEGLLQPFKNIREWIRKNITDPIKNALKGFSIEELIKGSGSGASTTINKNGFSGSGGKFSGTVDTSDLKVVGDTLSVDATANVTNLKDSVPQRKKILGDVAAKLTSLNDGVPIGKKIVNGVKGVFTSIQDKLTASQKTLPTTSKFTTSSDALTATQKTLSTTSNFSLSKDGLTAAQKTIGTTSKYTSASDALTAAQKTVGTKANFNSSADSLTAAQKKFNTSANFNSITDSLTAAQKKFGVVANFNSRTDSLTDANKSFNSKANFNTRSDSLTDANKTFDSKANFNKYSIDSKGTLKTGYGVWSYATAWFDDYEPYFDETPTIDVIANITGTTVDENGFSGTTGKFAKGGSYYGGAWHDIPQAASGGKFHGTMFWAGENGPEVVGHAGGRTEVLNRSQLAATMYSAVSSALSGIQMRVTGMGATPTGGDESMSEELMYRAMLRALNDSDVFPEELDLDGETVWRRMVQRNRQNTRMTGVNAMMTA